MQTSTPIAVFQRTTSKSECKTEETMQRSQPVCQRRAFCGVRITYYMNGSQASISSSSNEADTNIRRNIQDGLLYVRRSGVQIPLSDLRICSGIDDMLEVKVAVCPGLGSSAPSAPRARRLASRRSAVCPPTTEKKSLPGGSWTAA